MRCLAVDVTPASLMPLVLRYEASPVLYGSGAPVTKMYGQIIVNVCAKTLNLTGFKVATASRGAPESTTSNRGEGDLDSSIEELLTHSQ